MPMAGPYQHTCLNQVLVPMKTTVNAPRDLEMEAKSLAFSLYQAKVERAATDVSPGGGAEVGRSRSRRNLASGPSLRSSRPAKVAEVDVERDVNMSSSVSAQGAARSKFSSPRVSAASRPYRTTHAARREIALPVPSVRTDGGDDKPTRKARRVSSSSKGRHAGVSDNRVRFMDQTSPEMPSKPEQARTRRDGADKGSSTGDTRPAGARKKEPDQGATNVVAMSRKISRSVANKTPGYRSRFGILIAATLLAAKHSESNPHALDDRPFSAELFLKPKGVHRRFRRRKRRGRRKTTEASGVSDSEILASPTASELSRCEADRPATAEPSLTPRGGSRGHGPPGSLTALDSRDRGRSPGAGVTRGGAATRDTPELPMASGGSPVRDSWLAHSDATTSSAVSADESVGKDAVSGPHAQRAVDAEFGHQGQRRLGRRPPRRRKVRAPGVKSAAKDRAARGLDHGEADSAPLSDPSTTKEASLPPDTETNLTILDRGAKGENSPGQYHTTARVDLALAAHAHIAKQRRQLEGAHRSDEDGSAQDRRAPSTTGTSGNSPSQPGGTCAPPGDNIRKDKLSLFSTFHKNLPITSETPVTTAAIHQQPPPVFLRSRKKILAGVSDEAAPTDTDVSRLAKVAPGEAANTQREGHVTTTAPGSLAGYQQQQLPRTSGTPCLKSSAPTGPRDRNASKTCQAWLSPPMGTSPPRRDSDQVSSQPRPGAGDTETPTGDAVKAPSPRKASLAAKRKLRFEPATTTVAAAAAAAAPSEGGVTVGAGATSTGKGVTPQVARTVTYTVVREPHRTRLVPVAVTTHPRVPVTVATHPHVSVSATGETTSRTATPYTAASKSTASEVTSVATHSLTPQSATTSLPQSGTTCSATVPSKPPTGATKSVASMPQLVQRASKSTALETTPGAARPPMPHVATRGSKPTAGAASSTSARVVKIPPAQATTAATRCTTPHTATIISQPTSGETVSAAARPAPHKASRASKSSVDETASTATRSTPHTAMRAATAATAQTISVSTLPMHQAATRSTPETDTPSTLHTPTCSSKSTANEVTSATTCSMPNKATRAYRSTVFEVTSDATRSTPHTATRASRSTVLEVASEATRSAPHDDAPSTTPQRAKRGAKRRSKRRGDVVRFNVSYTVDATASASAVNYASTGASSTTPNSGFCSTTTTPASASPTTTPSPSHRRVPTPKPVTPTMTRAKSNAFLRGLRPRRRRVARRRLRDGTPDGGKSSSWTRSSPALEGREEEREKGRRVAAVVSNPAVVEAVDGNFSSNSVRKRAMPEAEAGSERFLPRDRSGKPTGGAVEGDRNQSRSKASLDSKSKSDMDEDKQGQDIVAAERGGSMRVLSNVTVGRNEETSSRLLRSSRADDIHETSSRKSTASSIADSATGTGGSGDLTRVVQPAIGEGKLKKMSSKSSSSSKGGKKKPDSASKKQTAKEQEKKKQQLQEQQKQQQQQQQKEQQKQQQAQNKKESSKEKAKKININFKGWDGGKKLAPHTMKNLPEFTDVAAMLLQRAAKLREHEVNMLTGGPGLHPHSSPAQDDTKAYLAKHNIQRVFQDFTSSVLVDRPPLPMQDMLGAARLVDKHQRATADMKAKYPFLRTAESWERQRRASKQTDASSDPSISVEEQITASIMADTQNFGRSHAQPKRSTLLTSQDGSFTSGTGSRRWSQSRGGSSAGESSPATSPKTSNDLVGDDGALCREVSEMMSAGLSRTASGMDSRAVSRVVSDLEAGQVSVNASDIFYSDRWASPEPGAACAVDRQNSPTVVIHPTEDGRGGGRSKVTGGVGAATRPAKYPQPSPPKKDGRANSPKKESRASSPTGSPKKDSRVTSPSSTPKKDNRLGSPSGSPKKDSRPTSPTGSIKKDSKMGLSPTNSSRKGSPGLVDRKPSSGHSSPRPLGAKPQS